MIFGNPKEIAVTYEVLARQSSSHFAFGTFNIFIGDKLLLNGGSDWTIDCLIRYLKKSENLVVAENEKKSKEELFRVACSTRGYWLYDTAKINSDWLQSDDPVIVKKLDSHLAKIDSMRKDPPFGHEVALYAELLDLNLRIFVFSSKNTDRIVHSFDRGKVVFETCVPSGTVKRLCESLPVVV